MIFQHIEHMYVNMRSTQIHIYVTMQKHNHKKTRIRKFTILTVSSIPIIDFILDLLVSRLLRISSLLINIYCMLYICVCKYEYTYIHIQIYIHTYVWSKSTCEICNQNSANFESCTVLYLNVWLLKLKSDM